MSPPDSKRAISAIPAEERRSFAIREGCYDATENARIFDKWFTASRPRDALLTSLARRYDFANSRICDVGCAYGMHVLLGTEGSYGIEIEPYEIRFAQSLGIDVRDRDLIEDDLSDLPPVDVVLALAVVEHIDSPHIFLRKLHGLLEDGGLVILETPRRPAIGLLERLPIIRRAYREHDDHINSFTASTLRFFCERAGFEVVSTKHWSKPLVNSYGFSPSFSGIFPFSLVAAGLVAVARKVPDWEYAPKATRRTANNKSGFITVGQAFPGSEHARSEQ